MVPRTSRHAARQLCPGGGTQLAGGFVSSPLLELFSVDCSSANISAAALALYAAGRAQEPQVPGCWSAGPPMPGLFPTALQFVLPSGGAARHQCGAAGHELVCYIGTAIIFRVGGF